MKTGDYWELLVKLWKECTRQKHQDHLFLALEIDREERKESWK